MVNHGAAKMHLSFLEIDDCLKTEKLLEGSPSPSNRISSPPMLLRWFWAQVPETVDRRVHKVIKWSVRSMHCSFKFNLWTTRNSSAVSFRDLLKKYGIIQ